jgi:inosose dehydratase
LGTNRHCLHQAETEEILAACPDTKLLFDVGHCAAGGGDVRYMVETYYDRIAAFHFKGWRLNDDVDKTQEGWLKNGTFRGLLQGNYPVDNEYVYKYAMKKGFDGWFFIEHDFHVQDPAIDLAESLAVMKQWEKEVK